MFLILLVIDCQFSFAVQCEHSIASTHCSAINLVLQTNSYFFLPMSITNLCWSEPIDSMANLSRKISNVDIEPLNEESSSELSNP